MGYAAGRTGYQQYANDLRSNRHTDWAYVAFFTKYPLNHFAYAVVEKVVISYANDNWGPDNIHRVFAHESSHIFGAADEYGSCACGGSYGHLNVPNNNCVNCFPPGTQVACLMNANTLAMCEFSRRQIGWDESLFPHDWSTIPIGDAAFPPGAPVATVARVPGHLDVFAVGNDGRVHNLWWDEGGPNWSMIPIGDAAFPPGAPVATVARVPGHLDVYAVGKDGRMYNLWWDAGGGG